jgi:hypothetical protein
MRHPILYFAFMIVSLPVCAQTVFNEAIGGPSSDQAIFGTPTKDGGYISVGWTKSFGAGGWDIYLVKITATGEIMWTSTFGGPGEEVDCSVQQTKDEGYIITARTTSFGAGSSDVYLIKTNSAGHAEWTKTIGGPAWEEGHYVLQTPDEGYIHTGYTMSYGAGKADVYLIKNDSLGNTQWAKTYGDTGIEHGHFIQPALGGGFIIAGETNSFGAGGYDVYIIKTDVSGVVEWSKTYGGPADEFGWAIRKTTDSCYIITGKTNSFGAGGNDIYLIKIDRHGNLLWSKTLGSPNDDFGLALQLTTDGGYIIAGETAKIGSDSADVYIIKTNSNGDLLWSHTYGGAGDDGCQSIEQTSDGGYFIAGYTNSFGAGDWDFYLIKTDSLGVTDGCRQFTPVTLINTVPTIVTTVQSKTGSGNMSSTCQSTSGSGGVVSFCTNTGISESTVAINTIDVYPNPLVTTSTIHMPYPTSDSHQFLLFDVLGNKVIQSEETGSSFQIERGNLKAGVYFFRVLDGAKLLGTGKLFVAN